jgi:hypothetical protein
MKRINKILLAIVSIIPAIAVLANIGLADAATLTSASMTLSDSRPSVVASYSFNASGFTTATAIECIQLKFNTSADMSGSVPTGMTTTSVTLASSTLVTATNWTASSATNGTVKLSYTTGAAPAASGNVVLGNITNGSTAGTAYFVQVNTYSGACGTGLVDTSTVGFIYTAGQAVTASVNPTLAFTVAGLASSTSINGSTTNVATTSGTIPFGSTATISTNAVAAQALSVSTNSGNGYSVYISYSGPLSNGSHSITDFSGTNATPTTFTAAGTENFGYTTNSSVLTQFASGKWAGLTTSNSSNPVASSTSAINNDTTDVGYQLGIASTTPTGSYSTTVIYTATPVY